VVSVTAPDARASDSDLSHWASHESQSSATDSTEHRTSELAESAAAAAVTVPSVASASLGLQTQVEFESPAGHGLPAGRPGPAARAAGYHGGIMIA